MINACRGKKVMAISDFYQALLENMGKSIKYVKEKSDRELGIEMTDGEWMNVCRVQPSATALRTRRDVGDSVVKLGQVTRRYSGSVQR